MFFMAHVIHVMVSCAHQGRLLTASLRIITSFGHTWNTFFVPLGPCDTYVCFDEHIQ